jgi:hypothetical protein
MALAALLGMALGTVAACAGRGAPGGAAGRHTIRGRVTAASDTGFDARGLRPALPPDHGTSLFGLAVAVCTIDGTPLRATSDAGGYFRLAAVPPGGHGLRCGKSATDGTRYEALKLFSVPVDGGEPVIDVGDVDFSRATKSTP